MEYTDIFFHQQPTTTL